MIRAGILTAALVAAMPAWAAPAGSRMTREFVQASAQFDAFEIAEAQLALTASSDPKVRAFAQMVIADHQRTTSDLTQAAVSVGLEPPPMAMSADQAALLAALQGLGAAEFDRAYVDQQVLGHRSALAVETQYADTGDTSALKRVASATTTVVEAHLRMANDLKTALAPPAD